MDEREHAVRLANHVLDRVNADPDDDLAVLARQFLRAREALQQIADQGDNNWTKGLAQTALGAAAANSRKFPLVGDR